MTRLDPLESSIAGHTRRHHQPIQRLNRHSRAEALADVFMGDDGGIFAEFGIAAGVITMEMGVDYKLKRLVIDAFQGFPDLRYKRCELIIDDDDAVFACAHTDIATGPLEHIDAAGDLRPGESVIR